MHNYPHNKKEKLPNAASSDGKTFSFLSLDSTFSEQALSTSSKLFSTSSQAYYKR